MTSKSFKDYMDDTDYKPKLKSDSKSIEYLEDLNIDEFIEAIKNMSKCIVAEKLDGTALTFGLDNDGNFYTTRSGKGSSDKMIYKASDWGVTAAANGFKAAHAALKKHVDIIKKILQPGEAIDIEIMYGRQPNTVVYGLDGYNYIAFLKATHGTKDGTPKQSRIKALYNAFKDLTSDVRTLNVDTTDGETLVKIPTVTNWKFTTPEFIDAAKFEDADVKKELDKLEKFLAEPNKEMSTLLHKDMTNFDVAKLSLTTVKGSMRSEAKGYKEGVNRQILDDYKLPIKKQLLDKFIRTVKPRLQDRDVEPDEDMGMEGVVVLDPKTQRQFKIVDKDLFTTLNKFNYEIRNNIRGVVRNDDEEAPLDARGGLLGTAKIRIAALFDMPGLAKAANTKKILTKFMGETAEETIKNIADSMKESDFRAFKMKIRAILSNTLHELQETLINFKENYADYKVKLDNGKSVGYTVEIVRRTLLVFAETKNRLESLRDQIEKAESMEDVIVVLFGRKIKDLFDDNGSDESMEESLVSEDGDGGDAGTTAGSVGGEVQGATYAGSIASVPTRLFKGKMVKRIMPYGTKIKKTKKKPLSY